MRVFIKSLLIFFCVGTIPLILAVVGYFYTDPFKVLRSYTTYSNPVVPVNRDHVSTETFLRQYKKLHYNSFILGSSRTMAFKPMHWKSYIGDKAVPFMFDASLEDIYGIYTKLAFLDSLHVPIQNAVIVLCRDASFPGVSNRKGHLFIKNYKVTHKNSLVYHYEFFKSYLNPKFMFCWYYYNFSKQYKDWMKGYIENRSIYFDDQTNEMRFLEQDVEIKNNPKQYYKLLSDLFYKRKGEKNDTISKITCQDIEYLIKIKQILLKHETRYRVLISPLYEQVRFNEVDLVNLRKLFGDNLFDFSGVNKYTSSKYNYFETSHFRPHIGDSILSVLYEKR